VESVFSLTDALEEFEGAVMIVTHSEEILRRVATRLIIFQGDAPFLFEGTYDEFLDSIGWEEEDTGGKKDRKKKLKGSASREQKREKAELLQERSSATQPLKKEIQELETRIGELEGAIAGAQASIAKASADGNSAVIQQVSQELSQAQRELELKLRQWEDVSKRLDEVERAFSTRLGEE